MESTSIGIILGLISMLGYGLGNAMTKVPVRKIGPLRTIFFRGFLLTILLLAVLFFVIDEVIISFWHIMFMIVISIGGYIALLVFYKGLSKGKVGVVTPIASSSVIITVVLSLIFFNEALNSMQWIAIMLIFLGIILITVNFRHFKSSDLFSMKSGVPYAVLTCVMWGIGFFLFKIPVMVIGPVLTALLLEGGIALWSGLHMKKTKQFFRLKKSMLVYIVFVAVTGFFGTLCFNMGIMHSDVSIVAPIAFSAPLITALYGRFIYNEHMNIKQWIAVILIILGIILISYH